jgi:hypothetical protein
VSGIASFLSGEGADGQGRSHGEILAYDDRTLEARHDFIQWLFPLPEQSRAVPGSPVLTPADIEAIHASDVAQRNLRAAAARMLAFYRDNDHWLRSHDHNHLRITRIVKSLRLLAGDGAADAFRSAILERVEAKAAPINAASLAFWSEA